jgi:hypothetical protein
MEESHIGPLEVPKVQNSNPQRALEAEFLPCIVRKWRLSFVINMKAVPADRAARSLT